MAGSFCTSELAVDSEKPSDTNHQWLRTKVMSSITFPGFCVKSSHATSQAARFLGYELVNQQANDQHDPTGRRRVNGRIGLRVPADVIEQHCQAYMRNGTPAHRSSLIHDDDYGIVVRYQSEYRGVVQYYLLAYNVHHFGRLHRVMEMSLARTLAAKHKATARKMRRQYKSVVETEHGPRVCLRVVKQQDNGKRPLEVWPESHWPGFALRKADVFQSDIA